MGLVAALAGVSVVVLIVLGAMGRDGAGPIAPHTALSSGRTLGAANAPVTLQVWEDFQCPFCKEVNAAALAQVEQTYVTAGQVRIEYHNYAFLGDESVLAAEAAESANDQGMFWPYHDALFAAQAGENRGAFSSAKLKQIAANLGLDTVAFNAALDGHAHRAMVLQEKSDGQALGVASTPTFFVNGQLIKGVQPLGVFQTAIDAALQKAQ